MYGEILRDLKEAEIDIEKDETFIIARDKKAWESIFKDRIYKKNVENRFCHDDTV